MSFAHQKYELLLLEILGYWDTNRRGKSPFLTSAHDVTLPHCTLLPTIGMTSVGRKIANKRFILEKNQFLAVCLALL